MTPEQIDQTWTEIEPNLNAAIAKLLGVPSPAIVSSWRARHNIPRRKAFQIPDIGASTTAPDSI